MELHDIRYFRQISEKWYTAGQPTIEQLRNMKEWHIDAIINLALPTSDWAVIDESSIITEQGIIYIQIPVDFNNPKREEFELFSVILDKLESRNLFIHCALNMRVSCFIYIYRMIKQKFPVNQAKEDLYSIWQPNSVWQNFIDDLITDLDEN